MTERHPFASYPAELAANFVEMFEGFKETAYLCPAGKLTIGFGHTGKDVKNGAVVTYNEAYEMLVRDLKAHIRELAPFISVLVTEGQFVALASLAFNVGNVPAKCPKLMRALNAGDEEEAAKQFLDVTLVNGKIVPGLVRRRKAEATLFLKDVEGWA